MLPLLSQQVVPSYWWRRSCCGPSWRPCGLPQPLCHRCPPQNKTKYGSVTGESVLPPKKPTTTINEHNEHHLPFVLSLSALPLQLPEEGCAGTSQLPPVGGGGGWWRAMFHGPFLDITPEEDCVGQLWFCCFLLSLSGFSLEEDCTGGMPTGKWGFFRRCADLALRWHQGQRWQLKRNYDLQDLVWMILCHWRQEDMGEGRALSGVMCTWCSWIRNTDRCH